MLTTTGSPNAKWAFSNSWKGLKYERYILYEGCSFKLEKCILLFHALSQLFRTTFKLNLTCLLLYLTAV